jgi:hypothetical protein
MRTIKLLLVVGAASILMSACGSPTDSLVTPAPDGLTYLYFYTEG